MRRQDEIRAGFSNDYLRILDEVSPNERVEDAIRRDYARMVEQGGEKLVRCIWFDQTLKTDSLRAEDGRPVTVHSPGWWNVEAGPDFRNAEFSIDGGEVVRADVEVHVLAGDWRRHGHDRDATYDDVGLHVVLDNDVGDAFAVTVGGKRVPQLVLGKHLSADLQEITDAVAPEFRPSGASAPGECAEAVARAGEEWICRFLDAAGDRRIECKAEKFLEQSDTRTPDDVLLEGFMDALGYKQNRMPFRKLARRLPAWELRRFVAEDSSVEERAIRIEAMLFGVAGLLPDESAEHDEETADYLARLHQNWRSVARELGGRALGKGEWRLAGVRPLNRPERRIGAAAGWLAQNLHTGLFRGLLNAMEIARSAGDDSAVARASVRGLTDYFAPSGDGYWAHRCTFGGSRLNRFSKLVGNDRAAAVVVNVAIPLMLAEARRSRDRRLEEETHAVYSLMKKLAPNHATRYVSVRLFGSEDSAKKLIKTARRQQGLQQLYADFCGYPDSTCGKCLFRRAADRAAGQGVPG